MDNSGTGNFHAFFVKKCEENGLDPVEVRRAAGVSHQVFTGWKKKEPKTLVLANKLVSAIDEMLSKKSEVIAVA
jgi:hypothetical protein